MTGSRSNFLTLVESFGYSFSKLQVHPIWADWKVYFIFSSLPSYLFYPTTYLCPKYIKNPSSAVQKQYQGYP